MSHTETTALLQRCRTAVLLHLAGGVLLLSSGCAVSAGTASSPLEKEHAAASTGVIPSQFFGMVVKNPAGQTTVAAGSRRLWDSGVTWAALEPQPGSFQWATLDMEVAAAEQTGAQVTLTLGMTPAWASSQPSAVSPYGAGATAMPAQIADWDRYVAAVATRYAGRISAYEVWNAPENPAYWSGASARIGANLATLAAHAAATVHAADPTAKIISPVLSPAGLSDFLNAGGGTSIDAVGVALFSAGQAPEAMVPTLEALRGALAGTAADGKPMWNDGGSWTLPEGGLSAAEQAAYAARALVLNAGYAVGRMHWYAWDSNDAYALALTDASAQPTAAATAYSTMESWLLGARMNGCAASAGGVWTCQIVQNGKTAWVLWSTNGTARSSSLGATTVTDLTGNVATPDADGSVQVGGSPVLLR